jgi:hypothetical protein
VLQQHSSVSADDPLQHQFEQAVLLFVSGEHRAAAAALQGVQAAAEAQGKKEIAGACLVLQQPLGPYRLCTGSCRIPPDSCKGSGHARHSEGCVAVDSAVCVGACDRS